MHVYSAFLWLPILLSQVPLTLSCLLPPSLHRLPLSSHAPPNILQIPFSCPTLCLFHDPPTEFSQGHLCDRRFGTIQWSLVGWQTGADATFSPESNSSQWVLREGSVSPALIDDWQLIGPIFCRPSADAPPAAVSSSSALTVLCLERGISQPCSPSLALTFFLPSHLRCSPSLVGDVTLSLDWAFNCLLFSAPWAAIVSAIKLDCAERILWLRLRVAFVCGYK